MIQNVEQEKKAKQFSVKIPYTEQLQNFISQSEWDAKSPVEQRKFLADHKLEALIREQVSVEAQKHETTGPKPATPESISISALPEKFQHELEQMQQRSVEGSAKIQQDVEKGSSFQSKNTPQFTGYQPDDQSIKNYKVLKKGPVKRASTWLAYVIQKWFEMVMQLS